MKYEKGHYQYSATDLAHHLSCNHLTELELLKAKGELELDHHYDPVVELLSELGQLHEDRYLEHLKSQGKSVVEIKEFGGQGSITETISAMENGVDVIAQAELSAPPWGGRADFLLKTDRPSELGSWSYEVADTKLSQTTKAGSILQLCLYTEILSGIQSTQPNSIYVIQPGDPFTIETYRVNDFMAYYRMVKKQFESFLQNNRDEFSYPDPNAHCQVCRWWKRCNNIWREDDHLTFVAGIGKQHIAELDALGHSSMESFANELQLQNIEPESGSIQTFQKLQRQAQLQVQARDTMQPVYELQDLQENRGLLRLPEPSEGDMFFDIEGYPRAIGESLEYLFGFVIYENQEATYRSLWATNKREEKKLFEEFMEYVMQRLQEWPDMHIYHYAPYEPSALKRLATKHATYEAELDQILRGKRLVDLYAVASQGIRAGVESYSIKELEQFYQYHREEDLKEASQSLRAVERMIELDLLENFPPHLKRTIEKYNQDDCVSTLLLRDWLENLRDDLQQQQDNPLPRLETTVGDASENAQNISNEILDVFNRLVQGIEEEPTNEDEQARWLLAHMLEYFRREDKSAWWEFFHYHELDSDELLRDRKAISGLQFVSELEGSVNLPTHRYRFPPQQLTLDCGDKLVEVEGDKIGSITAINYSTCTVDIKKRRDSIDIHPTEVFEFDMVSAGTLPGALLDFAREVAGGNTRSARYDLLASNIPRFRSLSLPRSGNQKDVAIEIAFGLDDSYLPIQGPPGAGKTYIGSHMIAELARAGNRIGVTAVSHRVIQNLLLAVHRNSQERGNVNVAHQSSRTVETPEGITHLRKREASLAALDEGCVVGATAWLWSHEEMEQQLDYLFIDEAGQMSLAMALAAGRAARNIVLLGDPQQLEQPQQGSHPEGSGVAALDHVLQGASTMPQDKGLFLEKTWRLHPSICEFTSEQYYDSLLNSQEGMEQQRIIGNNIIDGSGLRFVEVAHHGCQDRSLEEVEQICALVNELVGGGYSWVNHNLHQLPITLEDILIVAPYNSQVSAIQDRIPEGRIGTVDRFQGQEAPIVLYSMTSSSAADAPRGLDFLFSRNRMNVATSRARCLSILVGSAELFTAYCSTPEQMRLANGFCRFREIANS